MTTTWNAADSAAGITLSNNNLTASGTTGWKSIRSTDSKLTGKWYWEVTPSTTPIMIGAGQSTASLVNFPGFDDKGWGYYSTGSFYYNNIVQQTLASYVAGDVIGVALDMDAKTIQFYKNGVAQGTAFALKTAGVTITNAVYPMLGLNNSAGTADFGATTFAYSAPAGFTALSAATVTFVGKRSHRVRFRKG